MKLDSPALTLSFQYLRAAALQAPAESIKKLVESGLAIKEALALSGLLASDELVAPESTPDRRSRSRRPESPAARRPSIQVERPRLQTSQDD